MRIKVVSMEWFTRFRCIGGHCPLTCCSSMWKVALTEEEIKKYKNMNHSFQGEIMKWVDEKDKCMITDVETGKCGLLTEDGWCRMVLECGESYLSKTCAVFPRYAKAYGDIIETGVEIVCPVVAGYLLENVPIEFEFQEKEIDEKRKSVDYQVYDSLALAIIQIFAMSVWVLDGKIEKEKYEVLISMVDRIFSHKENFLITMSEELKKLGQDNIANILMILI